ncbi:hypothetical protein B0I35DRAFT_431276 [Stachybotrys elegans]|uniref:Uncharacterized protein n=1 Tax=Stachybotrys elegans TaxID=80388 RepID=A0A8K0SR23_9HYPO|nr:hypothetical protein B0I35DRAFT_431276 [Stachybotrys elegans]
MWEVKVAPETSAALAADLTARCLLKTRYRDECRHSKIGIPWARSRAEKITKAMLESIGQPTPKFSLQPIMVDLLGLRDTAFICFDIFLEGCNIRTEIDQAFERPVHIITHRAKVFHVRRAERRIEARVADEYRRTAKLDKGPRPFFTDLQNPPIYDLGRRLEAPPPGEDPEEEELDRSVSEEDDNEAGGAEGSAVITQVAVDAKATGISNVEDGGDSDRGKGQV